MRRNQWSAPGATEATAALRAGGREFTLRYPRTRIAAVGGPWTTPCGLLGRDLQCWGMRSRLCPCRSNFDPAGCSRGNQGPLPSSLTPAGGGCREAAAWGRLEEGCVRLEQQLAQLRTPLLRYAQLQLRCEALAEDAVSETLLGILEKPDAYSGASSLRTYATGILKHKIVDLLRHRSREVPIEPLDEQSMDDAIDALFVDNGHWADPPRSWGAPERTLEQSEFFQVLQRCIDRLPARLGRIFMMREWLELEVEQVCEQMSINANNCGVMLYRARMQLRECLDRNWFREQR